MEEIANFTWGLSAILGICFIISLVSLAKKPKEYTREKQPFE
jgi:hypothetical protein